MLTSQSTDCLNRRPSSSFSPLSLTAFIMRKQHHFRRRPRSSYTSEGTVGHIHTCRNDRSSFPAIGHVRRLMTSLLTISFAYSGEAKVAYRLPSNIIQTAAERRTNLKCSNCSAVLTHTHNIFTHRLTFEAKFLFSDASPVLFTERHVSGLACRRKNENLAHNPLVVICQ